MATRIRLCYKCLCKNHTANQCRAPIVCVWPGCKNPKRHNSVLCSLAPDMLSPEDLKHFGPGTLYTQQYVRLMNEMPEPDMTLPPIYEFEEDEVEGYEECNYWFSDDAIRNEEELTDIKYSDTVLRNLSHESDTVVEELAAVERMMAETDGRTEDLVDHLKSTILAMSNEIDPKYPVKEERWMKVAPPGLPIETPNETQSC